MSDTPRTDAAVLDYHGMVMEENGCVPADFARGLERELAAQQVRVQHLGRSRGRREARLEGLRGPAGLYGHGGLAVFGTETGGELCVN